MLFPGQNVRRTNKLLSPNRATNTDNAKQTRSLCLSLSLSLCPTYWQRQEIIYARRQHVSTSAVEILRSSEQTQREEKNEINFDQSAEPGVKLREQFSPSLSLSLSLEPASGGTRTCLEQSEQNERRYEGNRLCVRYALLLHAVPQDPRALSSSAEPGRGDKSSRE